MLWHISSEVFTGNDIANTVKSHTQENMENFTVKLARITELAVFLQLWMCQISG